MWGNRIVRDAQRHPGVGHVPCTCSIIRGWLHTCLLPSSHGVEVALQAFQPCDTSNSAAYGLMPNSSRGMLVTLSSCVLVAQCSPEPILFAYEQGNWDVTGPDSPREQASGATYLICILEPAILTLTCLLTMQRVFENHCNQDKCLYCSYLKPTPVYNTRADHPRPAPGPSETSMPSHILTRLPTHNPIISATHDTYNLLQSEIHHNCKCC